MASLGPEASGFRKEPRLPSRPWATAELQGMYMGAERRQEIQHHRLEEKTEFGVSLEMHCFQHG